MGTKNENKDRSRRSSSRRCSMERRRKIEVEGERVYIKVVVRGGS